MGFEVKRIYAPAGPGDGARILVNRLWPRGISKERAALSAWGKEAAPDSGLRQWFGHAPKRMEEFARQYRRELELDAEKRQGVGKLLALGRAGQVTLLHAAKDPHTSHALVLRDFLLENSAGQAVRPMRTAPEQTPQEGAR